MPSSSAKLVRYLRELATARGAFDPSSDAGLLDRFIQYRDDDAFAILVARHGPMVIRLCRRMLGDAHAAEDSFQATFLVLARKAGAIRRPQALAAWLYGVAYRVASKVRKMILQRRAREVTTHVHDSPAAHTDPLDDITARELLMALEEELHALPEVYRQPIVLCCLEGHSQEETARQLGWTPASVRGRLERGRARLHARLARRGMTLTAGLAAAETTHALVGGAVPVALGCSTVKIAGAFAAAKSADMSEQVAALTEGVLRAMFFSKIRMATALVLMIGMLAAGVGALSVYVRGGDPPSDAADPVPVVAPRPAADAPKIPKDLLEARLRAAKAVYEMGWRRFNSSLVRPINSVDTNLPEWSRRWLLAELAVIGDNKKDRITAHQKYLERARLLETMARASARVGQTAQSDNDAATYFRVEAEIWLIQAGGKLNRQAPPPAPKGK